MLGITIPPGQHLVSLAHLVHRTKKIYFNHPRIHSHLCIFGFLVLPPSSSSLYQYPRSFLRVGLLSRE